MRHNVRLIYFFGNDYKRSCGCDCSECPKEVKYIKPFDMDFWSQEKDSTKCLFVHRRHPDGDCGTRRQVGHHNIGQCRSPLHDCWRTVFRYSHGCLPTDVYYRRPGKCLRQFVPRLILTQDQAYGKLGMCLPGEVLKGNKSASVVV